jgi:hypothetical protein
MSSELQFNIQQYLEAKDARDEQRHKDLMARIDNGLILVNDRVVELDKRVVILEGTRKTLRWLSATAIGTAVTGAVAYLINLATHTKP